MSMTGTLESEMATGLQTTAEERERADKQFWEQPGKNKQIYRMDQNRPELKELKWTHASLVSCVITQSLVGVWDGIPPWKEQYLAYCETSKKKNQGKKVEKLEAKKAKPRKCQARKARRRQATPSGLGAPLPQMSCGASGPPTAEDGGEKTDHVEGDEEESFDAGSRMEESGPELILEDKEDEGLDVGDRVDEDGPEPVECQYREQYGPTPNTTPPDWLPESKPRDQNPALEADAELLAASPPTNLPASPPLNPPRSQPTSPPPQNGDANKGTSNDQGQLEQSLFLSDESDDLEMIPYEDPQPRPRRQPRPEAIPDAMMQTHELRHGKLYAIQNDEEYWNYAA
ncbi:MAG: hypothetical protein Q9188_005252 [Gyalolechia gomerana]